jgi:hypothetical protein
VDTRVVKNLTEWVIHENGIIHGSWMGQASRARFDGSVKLLSRPRTERFMASHSMILLYSPAGRLADLGRLVLP